VACRRRIASHSLPEALARPTKEMRNAHRDERWRARIYSRRYFCSTRDEESHDVLSDAEICTDSSSATLPLRLTGWHDPPDGRGFSQRKLWLFPGCYAGRHQGGGSLHGGWGRHHPAILVRAGFELWRVSDTKNVDGKWAGPGSLHAA
jgi:hypothetical protein